MKRVLVCSILAVFVIATTICVCNSLYELTVGGKHICDFSEYRFFTTATIVYLSTAFIFAYAYTVAPSRLLGTSTALSGLLSFVSLWGFAILDLSQTAGKVFFPLIFLDLISLIPLLLFLIPIQVTIEKTFSKSTITIMVLLYLLAVNTTMLYVYDTVYWDNIFELGFITCKESGL